MLNLKKTIDQKRHIVNVLAGPLKRRLAGLICIDCTTGLYSVNTV